MSSRFSGGTVHEGIEVQTLFDGIQSAILEAKKKLELIKSKKDQFSICDMFEMQMLMNNLSQISEMSTAIVSASNQALLSMARAIKQ